MILPHSYPGFRSARCAFCPTLRCELYTVTDAFHLLPTFTLVVVTRYVTLRVVHCYRLRYGEFTFVLLPTPVHCILRFTFTFVVRVCYALRCTLLILFGGYVLPRFWLRLPVWLVVTSLTSAFHVHTVPTSFVTPHCLRSHSLRWCVVVLLLFVVGILSPVRYCTYTRFASFTCVSDVWIVTPFYVTIPYVSPSRLHRSRFVFVYVVVPVVATRTPPTYGYVYHTLRSLPTFTCVTFTVTFPLLHIRLSLSSLLLPCRYLPLLRYVTVVPAIRYVVTLLRRLRIYTFPPTCPDSVTVHCSVRFR